MLSILQYNYYGQSISKITNVAYTILFLLVETCLCYLRFSS